MSALTMVPRVPDLSVQLGPLRLDHPLINASGTLEIFELAEVLGGDILQHPPVAAYVPKTVTLEPRPGNPPPRILETAGGMINAIGLPSEGLEVVSLAANLRHALDGATPGWVDRVGLEVNISCPNVHSGCASIGSDPCETNEVVAATREVWPGLLVVKLTPNVTNIAAIALAAVAGGADAIAAVNTFKGLVVDRETLKPFLGNAVGGLSGPAIKPLALRAVYEIFAAVDVPIIGMGGVACTQDVLDFMACGARVVAVGSAGFRDPRLARGLAVGLAEALAARGIGPHELVGRAHHSIN
jgi:dihydroorotate dehydrogenase (NAD+) catalytic subunit